jgi:gluconate 2-dehydrogenase gamma chain
MKRFSRRRFIASGIAFGSFYVTAASQSAMYNGELPWKEGAADAPVPITPGGYAYFAPPEVAFLDAAVSRLIPNDNRGLGAKEAGVTIFLDRQMAGPYGRADRWYMEGPFKPGAEEHYAYQQPYGPAQFYRLAIRAIDEEVRRSNGERTFAQLSSEGQDSLLQKLEKGDLKLPGVDGKVFFGQLLKNTVEGYFGDPIYGGNKDMAAWKMLGFPGARYDYRPYVDQHNVRLILAPVGIMGGPSWKSN